MNSAILKTSLAVVALTAILLPAQSAAAAAAGTSWNFDTTRVRFTFVGWGRVDQRIFGTLEMHFGPNVDEGLDNNEFVATNEDDYDFTGTFAEARGTRVITNFDLGVLETYLEAKLNQTTTATDIDVSITRIRPTVLIRANGTIQIVWKIKYAATGTYNGRLRRGVGKYEIRATGRLAEE